VKYLIATVLFITFLSVRAQQYRFINYSVEDGLASSQVTDICQDKLGYLWVGTQSGLSRFNGISFRNFSVNDGMPDNKIEQIYIDENQQLWIATPKGIAKYTDNHFIPYFFKPDKSEADIRINGLVSYQGQMYVATDAGMLRQSNKQFEPITGQEDESVLRIRAVVNVNDTLLLCGSRDGLLQWKNDEYSVYHIPQMDTVNISDLHYDNGTLYASTYGDGIITYDFKTKTHQNYREYNQNLRAVYADSTIILASTIRGGIEISQDGVMEYDSRNGLINESLKAAFKDREGNIWWGTDGNGLLKFSGKSILNYQIQDGLNSELVMSIAQDQDSNYIFGTYNAGLTIWDGQNEFSYLDAQSGLRNNQIWSIAIDQYNRCFIGSTYGIDCIDKGIPLNNSVGLSQIDSKIRSIYFLANGDILAGGQEGLFRLSGDNISDIHPEMNWNINKIVGNNELIYIGANSGLFEYNPDKPEKDVKQIPLAENNIQTLCPDSHGNLWIGTINGLFLKTKQDGTLPVILDQNEFFRSKNIVAIIEDHEGNIWVSTYNGVYLLLVHDMATYDFETRHYTLTEGLVHLEGNQNALYEDHLHNIWIGTSGGLAKIDPSLNNILFDFKKPELHFTGIRLFMEEFDYTQYESVIDSITGVPKEITLPYGKNHLTFDFIGINMKDPNGVSYAYRLLGASDEWSPVSATNYATYSFLTPGEYDFQVKAANKNMEWSDIQNIHITILPPFWQSWWFSLLIVLFLLLLIVTIFRIRIRAIKQKQENERLGFKNRLLFLEQRSLNASMNRHFIFNSLNSIQYFINSSDKRSANKYLSSFAKLIRKNLDSSTSNNFIVTLQEEIERIELYLTLEKMRFHNKFDYVVDIESGLDTEEIEIPSMILQPFVENSIIHGVLPLEKKGEITVKIYEEYGEVVFEVMDNGIGIDNSITHKEESLSGDHESKGMEITNRRIELLRKLTGENLLIIGPFQLNNQEGEVLGTKVIIKMGLEDPDD
jgi:ligand-binding sensor domain-containing protein